MNPDQRHLSGGHPFALPNDLRSIDLPLEPPVNTGTIPPVMVHRGTRPPNPSYNMRRRSTLSPQGPHLTSHPDDNPGPWTRRSASWSRAEDERLAQLVRMEEANSPTNTPTKMWSRVAAQLTGRTGKQCRERWLNQLKPGIRRGSWTDEEEKILHTAHAELGNKWVAIATRLPGRTDNCVKNHWNSMLRKRQRREAALRTTYGGARGTPPSLPPTPSGNSLMGQVNPDLARRVSAIADEKKSQNPTAALYETMRAHNPSLYENMAHSLMDIPGLTSPITPQRNAKLQIANLVGPVKGPPAFQSSPLPSVGEKRQAPPLNYEAGSKRRSVLHPSAQLTPAARRGPLNRTLNHSTFNNYPNMGRSAGMPPRENVPQLSSFVPYMPQSDASIGVYPYGQHHYSSMSPVSTPVASAPAGYMGMDQRMWPNTGYSVPEPRIPQHLKVPHGRLTPLEGSELTKSLEPAVGSSSDGLVKRSRSGYEFAGISGKADAGSTGPKTPSGATQQLYSLSAVASSLPPSPLTPESRFSSTSLSSNSSPGRRDGKRRATSPDVNGSGMGAVGSQFGSSVLGGHGHSETARVGEAIETRARTGKQGMEGKED